MSDSSHIVRRTTLRNTAAALLLAVAAIGGFASLTRAETADAPSNETWNSLKTDVFANRPIKDNEGLISIEAPRRAQDAALVPVDIRIDPAKAPNGVKAITLIIDVNPSPVAATFKFGDNSGVTHFSTRVRVNDYSFVRAIAETQDGQLYMTETFVKASGGCSAPAVKNQDEAKATMGQMKLRQFAAKDSIDGRSPELQLMIRHPNNSGLQRDPQTQLFIPPHFIHELSVMQGDRKIFSMESGISISEDPNFRFNYHPDGKNPIRVEATDTDGNKFQDQWPLETAKL
ncbi:quinoprotein dehydrogenase-associated SoxYZ-like carrier [Pseudaminobacter soli (ex Li et al. 2025)]|uniref:Quinoprotein dehydrogenase-associated SoxYZ-like carrier n=1 Tax=Pseudaminobacter soli (ex Li et al. 2025) TaxID=1295366 RepID=A0A2P7S6S7_9HYPH|nr:quinoprotein dehydrogenase-associated SoxYZ-like carrier [Mesorhizobium soli]PSJ58176.1 quinoprotein dehydrogenase-associated SoxYZ-like carrier [Mesorhizobium soli]